MDQLSPEQLVSSIIQTVNTLKKQGATEENNPEYGKLVQFLKNYSANMRLGAGQPASTSAASATPIVKRDLDEKERELLKLQIYAYRQLSTNKSLSEPLRQALLGTKQEYHQSAVDGNSINPKVTTLVEAAYAQSVQRHLNDPIDTKSAPFDVLPSPLTETEFAKAQLFLNQNARIVAFDPLQLIKEREERTKQNIERRIRYLEALPSNLSNNQMTLGGGSNPKLRALIELKGLRLVERQKRLRLDVLNALTKSTTLQTAVDRSQYKKSRKVQMREFSQTEKIEKDMRSEREKRERQRHVDYCNSVINHGREMMSFYKTHMTKATKLGAAVLKFHTAVEREEQRRAQKLSQERLNALRANDEEAYLKLVDQAKDTRITQILSQTSTYLSSLSAAVVTQQEAISTEAPIPMLEDDGDGESGKADYYNTAHKIREVVTEQSSLLVGGKLKEYQIKGLQWMISLYNNRLNGILADEMGLGKTIQTISLITYLIEKKKQFGPFLIIVPLGTITNWQLEFEKWAPSVTKIVFKGQPQERIRLKAEIRSGNFNVVITTYEYIIKEKAVLSKIKWVYLIIDEGHRMKNTQSKLSTTIMQYYSTRYRLILTGTPLQNNLPELWALLNFILPKIFNSIKTFDEWFSSPFASSGNVGQASLELNEEERLLMVKGLHKALRPFLLRRLKKDVESELPDKVEIIVKCAMSALQRKITERVKILRNIGPFDVNSKFSSGARALNNLVMQLRKICNHPFVFPEVEELFATGDNLTNDLIFRSAGKFELLDRILPKFFRTGHRVLMFFQMTQIMDIMEDYLRYRGWKFLRLDGHIKSEDRGSLLKDFNARDSEYQIFILSTRAGGLGLNLQTADTVVIFDSDWNPHQDLQAQDRAHRIGQTKEVRIVRLITTNSIEEHILSKAQQKLNLDEKVIQAGKFDQKTSEKEREELLRLLFEKEESKEDTEESAELTDEQLNEMLARGPDELNIFNEMDQQRIAQEYALYGDRPRLMVEKELPEFYQVDLETLREEEKDELMAPLRSTRERKAVRYDDNLTEEQWIDAIETGDIEGAIQRKQSRRASRKGGAAAANESNDEDDDEEAMEVPEADADAAEGEAEEYEKKTGGRRGKRGGRKSTASVAAQDGDGMDVDEAPAAEAPAEKKKGGRRKSAGGRKGKAKKNEPEDSLPPPVRSALTKIFDTVMDAIRNLSVKEEDGVVRYRSAMFETLPSKKAYKDYYKIIANPIALDTIDRRCDTFYYNSLDGFKADLKTMFENARQFNQDTSQIVQDANAIEAFVLEKLEELAPGGVVTPDAEEPAAEEGEDEQAEGAPATGKKRSAEEMDGGSEDGEYDREDGDAEEAPARKITIKLPVQQPRAPIKISLPKRQRTEDDE
ncbi:hypothetical protein HDU96_005706 [Phlyctochytrium bullatum]|nr:hypothetical protein HDU96_005706 [Phlyctochytrium bullatum]